MRLLIVSHTPHAEQDGVLAGWGPTVREIDALASVFESVVHIAPVGPPSAGGALRPYTAPSVEVRPVRPTGGSGPAAKAAVAASAPSLWRLLDDERRRADAIHVRAPAGISLLALLRLLGRRHRPLWVKFAGNWRPRHGEPAASRIQRALLGRPWPGLAVTVNGTWAGDAQHVHAFANPCLTHAEWVQAGTTERPEAPPLRMLFVGALEPWKGPGRALTVLQGAIQRGMEVELDMVGDGSLREELEQAARARGLASRVAFHGWIPRRRLDGLYAGAHVIVLPSAGEGWPKVLSEAMAHGVIPLASPVSSIPAVLRTAGVGAALPRDAPERWVDALEHLGNAPDAVLAQASAARRAAEGFTYERYLDAVRALFWKRWGLALPGAGA